MNRIKRIWILGLLLIGASCNSWLDVAPEDQIMEKDLFEEREGFLMALNGVYLNMNSSSNYGGNLSAGIIDVMAQYYNCTTSEHNYSGYQSYAYDSKTSKDRFETVWKTTYSQISNLNAILEHCGDGNPVRWDYVLCYISICSGCSGHFGRKRSRQVYLTRLLRNGLSNLC